MAPLDSITKNTIEQDLVATFMEIIPKTMGEIRHGLRLHRNSEFSVPQFRVMMKLRKGDCTNGELAEHIGLSIAAMSRLVQGLVKKGFLKKNVNSRDRRKVRVELSQKGLQTVLEIRDRFRRDLSKIFSEKLDAKEKKDLHEGFLILKKIFNY